MSAHDDKVVDRVAARIRDGEPVDWDAVTSEEVGPIALLRSLRLIEQIDETEPEVPGSEGLPFESWGALALERFVARGGFADVFLARDRKLDCDVALKLDREPGGARDADFVEEARRQARVRHENVVTVHGVDRFENRIGLWMEWIDGEPLEQQLERGGRLSAEEAVVIGVALCRALAAVHAVGLAHRDVKTTNVMREVGGRIVLMDFGSSTRSEDPRWSGTPAYLPPGARPGDPGGIADDLYALGVTLYRLTSGAYTRDPRDPADRVVPLRDRNPDLPHGFVQVVERAIDPEPSRRFASAGEMEQALGACLGEAPRPSGRREFPVRAAVAAIAIVAVLSAMFWPRALDAEASFFRAGAKAGVEERLLPGASVELDEELFLELELSRKAWLYVFSLDGRGEENLLFPVPGLELQNPVAAGRHRLPGAVAGEDKQRHWQVTSVGGSERLLVIASARPRDEIEATYEGLPQRELGGPIRLREAKATEVLRGIGGLSAPREVKGEDESAVGAIGRHARLEESEARNLRVWWLTLSGVD